MLTLEYVIRLGRTKRVSSIMMKDRGYKLPPQDEKIEDETDLNVGCRYLSMSKKLKKSLGEVLTTEYHESNKTSVLVYFFNNNFDDSKKKEKMVSCEQSKQALAKWNDDYKKCTECILICPSKLSPDSKKEVSIPRVTVLCHEFFIMPIGRHCLVPKHECLSEKEAEFFLQQRNISRDILPQLKEDDPVSLYYGFKAGNIIKVSRPSWTVFRVVTS